MFLFAICLIFVSASDLVSSDSTTTKRLKSSSVATAASTVVQSTTEAPVEEKCGIKDADPFLWITSIYELKDIVLVCDFFRNMSYQCTKPEPASAALGDPMASQPGTEIPVSEIPVSEIPVAEITIDTSADGITHVNVTCPANMNSDSPATTAPTAQFELMSDSVEPNQLPKWQPEDGMISAIELQTNANYSIVAKCFLRASWYECFGVPTCTEDCTRPCFGGEPWRGFYRNDTSTISGPGGKLIGNITAQAQAASGSGSAASPSTPIATTTEDTTISPNTNNDTATVPRVSPGELSVCKSDNNTDCVKLRTVYQNTGTDDLQAIGGRVCQQLWHLLISKP